MTMKVSSDRELYWSYGGKEFSIVFIELSILPYFWAAHNVLKSDNFNVSEFYFSYCRTHDIWPFVQSVVETSIHIYRYTHRHHHHPHPTTPGMNTLTFDFFEFLIPVTADTSYFVHKIFFITFALHNSFAHKCARSLAVCIVDY